MKKIIFKQNNKKRSLLIAVVYFLLVFGVYLYFEISWDEMAETANKLGPKDAALVFGGVLLLPFIFLLIKLSPKMVVTIGGGYFIVGENKNDKLKIPLTELRKSELNVSNLNTIDIFNKSNQKLISFQPNGSQNIIYEIANEINQHLKPRKETLEKNYFGKKFTAIIYTYP